MTSLAAVLLIRQEESSALYLKEPIGVRLVYQTSLTYSADIPKSWEERLPAESRKRHQVTFLSTTFVEHRRIERGNLVSDIRTWTESPKGEGWLSLPENQPRGAMSGGGLATRTDKGKWLVVPSTTDFAPEIPLPQFPNQEVRPGSAWKVPIAFEGRQMEATHRLVAYEERGGIPTARIEVSGISLAGMAQAAPTVFWVALSSGRTVRVEGLFMRKEQEATARLQYTRWLVREEPVRVGRGETS